MADRSTLPHLALMAACLAAPLAAQQLPLTVDPEWSDLGGAITFQAAGDEAGYTLDIEDCPELNAQCIVLNGRGATVYLTYSINAASLRGQRIRFAASLLVDYPAISHPKLFVRVDRPAGVGFHEYTKSSRDDPREWTVRELIGTVDEDAKQISVGLRLVGRGTVYLADPKLEKAAE